jgi:RNA polymerase sigma-70 factor (ECF subfamily)
MDSEQARAFTGLIEQNYGRWLAYIRGRLRHEQDAEDLLQNVLLEVCRQPAFDPRLDTAGGFVAQRINWRLNDRFRQHGRRPPVVGNVSQAGSDRLAGLADPEGEAPLEALARAERAEELAGAMAELIPEQQVVLALSLKGLSPGEIAALLGVPKTTVNMRLFRARELLRGRLGDGPGPV